ncbi:MAG: serine/threonine-protein kinase [Tepidisphaeraceae bacterium]
MDAKRTCPRCQKPLPPDVPLGLCPECLIKAGFNTGTESGGGGTAFIAPTVEQLAALFPQLEIVEFIGKGGMGAVYKARQAALDRFVALKILPPRVAGAPGFAERFNREARALARLVHPNIVAVHDFGQAGELHYLIMEFVDGTNLREVERAGRLAPEQALAIVPQICEALQFAHNEGIVHRDIKPENILLDKKGRVKITDFGIAKILGVSADKASLTGASDVIGTPHYMAPEQIERPTLVDHRADIFSLGVVFYEMLTGELPLGKFAPPSQRVQIDVRLDEVVLHALEKEPGRRYQQANQVKAEVETIAGSPASRAAPSAANKRETGTPLFPPSFGLTFTSRMALNMARTGWVLGCLAALGFIPDLKWMFGFAGFFGLIGLAVLIEVIHRRMRAGWLAIVVAVLAGLGVGGYTLVNWMRMNSNPRVAIADAIQREVGRDLKVAGASYDDLQVTVSEDRGDGTPFGVNYSGLRNFKSADGTIFNNSSGEFIMAYIGAGQWQGSLAGTQFTVQVGKVDNIDLPFVDDPDVIGQWKSVDFVADKSEFNPNLPNWKGELYWKGLTFLKNGKTPQPWLTWTKGVVIHHGDKTASHYDIQEFEGQRYLFIEFKSGDVTILGKKPMYYVMRWSGSTNVETRPAPAAD